MDGIQLEDVSIDTRATSARFEFHHGPETEPLVPPIYHSSTYKLKSVDDYLKILDEVSIKTENKIKSDPDVLVFIFCLLYLMPILDIRTSLKKGMPYVHAYMYRWHRNCHNGVIMHRIFFLYAWH